MDCQLLSPESYRAGKSGRSISGRYQHYVTQAGSAKKGGENSPFRFITEFNLEGHERETLDGRINSVWAAGDEVDADSSTYNDDIEDIEDRKPTPSQLCYSGACKMMKLTPVKYFFDGLRKKTIIMKNHLLGYSGARACAIALAKNCEVNVLTLEGNKIGGRGASCLAQALGENFYITDLTIAENSLGTLGAKVICEALSVNRTVKKLNLSGNSFKEKDAVHFRDLLEANHVLEQLNVSHNEFRETGGEILAEGLCCNDSLEYLDLSWNHLRLKGAVAIGNSLEQNSGLEYLNLGWNGFHNDGCTALGQSLCRNKTLTTLDLTCNRICEYSLPPLVDALEKNNTLEVLRLGYNSLGMDGSMSLIQVIESGSSAIRYLDIGMQCVYTDFVDSEKRIASRRPFRTTHGVVLVPNATYDGGDERDSRMFEGDSPMLVLMEFMRLQNLRLVDLFSTFDKDGDHQISHDEIRNRLLETNVPLSDAAIDRLIARLDADCSGTIDFGEMFAGQKEHKRLVQKLLARAEGSWEDTTTGKISIKMQHVMDKRLIMRSKERAAAERYQREDEEKKLRLKRRQDEIERAKREAAEEQQHQQMLQQQQQQLLKQTPGHLPIV